jgi:hypothetical protein
MAEFAHAKGEERVSDLNDRNIYLIQQGDLNTLLAIRFYAKSPLTRKHLVVVYKELNRTDGFVLTAYYTSAPSQRRVIVWKRSRS